VKTVALALDEDEAGHEAAARLEERLTAEGFAVKCIFPPAGKDWNEYLVSGGSGAQLKALLEGAEVHRGTGAPDVSGDLIASRDGPRRLYSRGDLSYRLLRVRPAFLSNLRVNVRVQYGGSTYLDNVDLYSDRSRGAFAAALSHLFDREARRVERDLLAMVDHLEAERDREMAAAATLPEAAELSEEERKAGWISCAAPTSRKMEDPISVLIRVISVRLTASSRPATSTT
jgi:hypothetical protein